MVPAAPIPLARRIPPHATLSERGAFIATLLMLALPCLALLCKALLER